ncbi:interferon-related developmental regulator 1-like [Artemia franciscana]|uniref:Interferon-related developmental regulator 1 n=1 Tax=Artemia franciscana TaxID=6661 RepID=A0AA88HTV1_ARTSF|nr:hypothetical protein QYM36_010295 [Artemia franciscana]
MPQNRNLQKKTKKEIDSKLSSEDSLELNTEWTMNTNQSNIPDKIREKTEVEPSENNFVEEQLLAAIDLTSQKSQNGRIAAMKIISQLLSKKYLPSFAFNNLFTLQDCIVKGLKKGRSAEQKEAAKLASVLCFQIGATDGIETFYKELSPLFLTLVKSSDISLEVREQCCLTLGVLCFIALDAKDEIEQTMKILKNIYKTDDPNDSLQVSSLKCAALTSWCLLCTLLPAREVYESASSNILTLLELLESEDLNLRIEAGEAVALTYEMARQFDDDICLVGNLENEAKDDVESKLSKKLKQLANDSQKSRAKKERKLQRSTFRDILKAIESGKSPNVHIKFGHETLVLNSWSQKKRYEIFCDVLSSGIDLLLVENEILREVFELGLPLLKNSVLTKLSKRERHAVNAASLKMRTRSRQNNRANKMIERCSVSDSD